MSDVDLLSILTASPPSAELPPMPIEPAWITAGNPVARGTVVSQSQDKKMSSGVWSCEPGEFDWEFGWDEFVHVLEGKVTITEHGGKSHDLGPGDMAHFPLGLKAHWVVKETVRKFFVIRTPEPFEL